MVGVRVGVVRVRARVRVRVGLGLAHLGVGRGRLERGEQRLEQLDALEHRAVLVVLVGIGVRDRG